MVKFVTAALGLVMSMAVGGGLAEAHDEATKPTVSSGAIDSLQDSDLGATPTATTAQYSRARWRYCTRTARTAAVTIATPC